MEFQEYSTAVLLGSSRNIDPVFSTDIDKVWQVRLHTFLINVVVVEEQVLATQDNKW